MGKKIIALSVIGVLAVAFVIVLVISAASRNKTGVVPDETDGGTSGGSTTGDTSDNVGIDDSVSGGSTTGNTGRVAIGSNVNLMVPILNVEDPEHDAQIIKKYLRSGDILVFPPTAYQQAQTLKEEIPGLKLGTGGTNIEALLPGIERIPGDVEYVTYDYERDFTPEWTTDQQESIGYFKQLYDESHEHNKKLVAVPVYVFGKDWDWGEVAKNVDVLVVQVQNFQTDAKVPDSIKPAALGIDLEGVTKKIVAQVEAKSPSTKVYLQFGFEVTDDPLTILTDIERVKDLGIDGVTLWYNPGTSQATSKIPLLEQVLEKVDR